MHGQVGYLQIPASDVDASAAFYRAVFGWQADPGSASFEAPGLIGQFITERPPGRDAGPVLWIHVADIEHVLDLAREHGATLRDGITPDGPRLLASVLDPAGNLIGVAQAPDEPEGVPSDSGAERPPAPAAGHTMPACTFVPEFAYEDIGVAIDFLRAAFGFEVRWRAGDHRAQLAFADGAVAVAEASSSRVLRGPQSIIVRVADVDAHCRWARGAGAAVLAEPQDFHYGERQYTAEDPGGHHWTFSQTIADLTPEQWGGTSGSALV